MLRDVFVMNRDMKNHDMQIHPKHITKFVFLFVRAVSNDTNK